MELKGESVQTSQPGATPGPQPVQWMPKPDAMPGCPPGLEYLTQVDQLVMHQAVELLEAMVGWEVKNRYQIKNSLGQQIFFAKEESSCCMRQCCKQNRGFVLHITDNFDQEVIRIIRDFKCCVGCCWCAGDGCCAFELVVESPVGQVCGYVRQEKSAWKPNYTVMSADREVLLNIGGPCCVCDGPCCPNDQEFHMFSADGIQSLGVISKQYSGFVKEMFTSADNFGVTFPLDLDVRAKATTIGALFLIDFMFFEGKD